MLKARLFDIPLYLTVAGMLQAFVTLLLLGWWAVRRPSLADAARFMDRAALFNALLLSLGCAASSIWMVTIYERWYTSADTVVDFLPFFPFGQWVLDQEFDGARGRLLGGATLRQLQTLWLALAAPVWVGSVLLYRKAMAVATAAFALRAAKKAAATCVIVCGASWGLHAGAGSDEDAQQRPQSARSSGSGSGTATAAATTAARLPNVVLILADDLGYGDLASYGHPIIRTPRLDRLAREGIRLTSYYAGAPTCTPSRAALLTGRYPIRVGLPQVLGPGSTRGLPRGEMTIADALKRRGYRTQMIGKWHLGHASPEMLPTAHGFDHWFGLPYSNDMKPPFVQTKVPLRLYRDTTRLDGNVGANGEVDQDALTVRYTEEAVKFINDAADAAGAANVASGARAVRRSGAADAAGTTAATNTAGTANAAGAPFFLYLAHNMPHLPLHAPARFRGKSAAGLYGDVIEMLDWSTGQILDTLAARGLADNTIVIFTSDNGPWLDLPARMLQEGNERWHAGSSGLLRGAKATTWEGGIRVPAIVRWPGHIPAGQVSGGLTTSMDLYVTLLSAAGATIPPDRDGHDLTPLLAGRTTSSPTNTFFYFQDANLQGVREGPWKLRKVNDDAAPELFQLELDPSEQYDRAKEHPEIVDRLLARMKAWGLP